MTVYYFDTSALVKHYVPEPGSDWVNEVIGAGYGEHAGAHNVILLSEITRPEVAAGLAAIERSGRISRARRDREYRRFLSDLVRRFAVVPIRTTDMEGAADLTQQHPLKAYDAVQLAIALRCGKALAGHDTKLVFVSGDRTQISAAQAEGLLTDDPFDHIAPVAE